MDDPISRVVEPVARLAAIICGYAVLLLSLAVSVEIRSEEHTSELQSQ